MNPERREKMIRIYLAEKSYNKQGHPCPLRYTSTGSYDGTLSCPIPVLKAVEFQSYECKGGKDATCPVADALSMPRN